MIDKILQSSVFFLSFFWIGWGEGVGGGGERRGGGSHRLVSGKLKVPPPLAPPNILNLPTHMVGDFIF